MRRLEFGPKKRLPPPEVPSKIVPNTPMTADELSAEIPFGEAVFRAVMQGPPEVASREDERPNMPMRRIVAHRSDGESVEVSTPYSDKQAVEIFMRNARSRGGLTPFQHKLYEACRMCEGNVRLLRPWQMQWVHVYAANGTGRGF